MMPACKVNGQDSSPARVILFFVTFHFQLDYIFTACFFASAVLAELVEGSDYCDDRNCDCQVGIHSRFLFFIYMKACAFRMNRGRDNKT